MKKTEIRKEVAAIRKLAVQSEKLSKEIRERQAALAKAVCPWKIGQEIEWTYENGRTGQGRIRDIYDANIHASSTSLWCLHVNKRSSYGRLLRDYTVLHHGDSHLKAIKLVPEVTVARDAPIYRGLPWINLKTEKTMFGIQISVAKGKWQNLAENGKPCVYATAKERDARIRELRSKKP